MTPYEWLMVIAAVGTIVSAVVTIATNLRTWLKG